MIERKWRRGEKGVAKAKRRLNCLAHLDPPTIERCDCWRNSDLSVEDIEGKDGKEAQSD